MNTIPYIVADNKIPYLKGILEPYARIDYLSPERINAQTVQDADILLIRTRTKCNREPKSLPIHSDGDHRLRPYRYALL